MRARRTRDLADPFHLMNRNVKFLKLNALFKEEITLDNACHVLF